MPPASIRILPWIDSGRPNDTLNQPRLGAAYRLNDRTVLRGGVGKYYEDTFTNQLSFTKVFNLFNRFNPNGYTTNESNINYGKPTESGNIGYSPRVFQFGFRSTF